MNTMMMLDLARHDECTVAPVVTLICAHTTAISKTLLMLVVMGLTLMLMVLLLLGMMMVKTVKICDDACDIGCSWHCVVR